MFTKFTKQLISIENKEVVYYCITSQQLHLIHHHEILLLHETHADMQMNMMIRCTPISHNIMGNDR